MRRHGLSRMWTDDDIDAAQEIVAAVHRGGGQLVGTLSVIRELGWDYHRDSVKYRVWDLMPLAVMLTPTRFPGKALIVHPDHTYQISDEAHSVMRVALTRAKQVRTKVERIAAELAPLEGSLEIGHIVLRQQVALVLNALDPSVWDAVIAEVQKASGSAEEIAG